MLISKREVEKCETRYLEQVSFGGYTTSWPISKAPCLRGGVTGGGIGLVNDSGPLRADTRGPKMDSIGSAVFLGLWCWTGCDSSVGQACDRASVIGLLLGNR